MDKKIYKSTVIFISDVCVEVRYKAIKTLRLTVYPDRKVILTVPLGVSLKRAVEFATERQEWIKGKLALIGQKPTKRSREYKDGEMFYVLGRAYALKTVTGVEPSVCLDGDKLLVKTKRPSQQAVKGLISEFYKEELSSVIQSLLPELVKLTGLCPQSINYKNLKSVWGRCDYTSGQITFSLQLLSRNIDEIKYVVMHELCHLKVPNHGKNFKSLETRFMPSWRQIKKKLAHSDIPYTTVI